jgi:ASC-1-like (ASCH) protein
MQYNFEAHRDKQPFENIKNGTKKMEIRLYDEKRQKIQLGDIAKLINRDNENEILFTRIIGLSRFASFEDMYRVLGDRIKD